MLATPNTPPKQTASPENRLPIYFAGGLGYNAVRNETALHYLEDAHGLETVPPLPDPDATVSTSYHLVSNGEARQLTGRQALKYAGDPTVESLTSDFQRQRADQLLDTLERAKYPKVDAIFQSADALNGLLAMGEQPERFNNVVLAYPAGVAQQPRLFEASRGAIKTGAISKMSDFRARRNPERNFEAGLQVKSKRGDTMAKVIAPSVALSYQGSLLSELRQQEDAPGVSLVLGLKDHMMPPNAVIQSLRSANDVDYILVTNSPHAINGSKDVMDEVAKLFPRMDQLKQAKEEGNETGTLASRLVFTDDVPKSKQIELTGVAAQVDARTHSLKAAA